MITPHLFTRLFSTFVFVLSLSFIASGLFAQEAAPAPAPAPAAPAKPAQAKPAQARPAPAAPAATPAVDKPLSFRFREIEKETDLDRIKNQTAQIISKGDFDKPSDKEVFAQFYKDYFFGRWINYGKIYQIDAYPEVLRKQARTTRNAAEKKKLEAAAKRWTYPCFIEDFRSDLNRSRNDGEPQKIAVKSAYDFAMEVIASKNAQCTPAVKYNCVLLLGNLYYRKSASAMDLPVVYNAAFETLIKIASGASTPRYLRIGSLMALNQIIEETNLTDKQKSDVYNVLLNIVKVKVDPAAFASSKDDPSGEGANWTRRLAVEGLRLLADFNARVDKTNGFYPGKEALAEVYKIIVDKNAPMTLRIEALESLGSYNFNKYSELKAKLPPSLQRVVASLIIEAIQLELDRKVDKLVWGDEAEEALKRNGAEENSSEPVDTTNNAIFLLQRALPVIYSAKVALEGVNVSKGWSGISKFGSNDDVANADAMLTTIKRDVNTVLNDLTKELLPSSSTSRGGELGSEMEEDFDPVDKLQEVTTALKTIQDAFRPFIE